MSLWWWILERFFGRSAPVISDMKAKK